MYRRITLTTDFSAESQTAFHHALALAVRFASYLDILHVRQRDSEPDWSHYPHVRDTLATWGLVDADAKPEDVVRETGVTVNKIDIPADDSLNAMVRFVQGHSTDLLVAASHGRTGLNLWLKGSMATDLSQKSRIPALLLGPKSKPFANAATGRITLDKVLFPVADQPNPEPAFEELVQMLEGTTADVKLLHVRQGPSRFDKGQFEGLRVMMRDGDPVQTILSEAANQRPDLLVMATEGQKGLGDALRGSTTTRVLHDALCPILAVPV